MSPPDVLSPIGGKFRRRGVKFPGSNVMWPALKCISIRKTRTVDLGWVNISRVISGVSGPKFTKFFYSHGINRVLDNTFYHLSISLFVPEKFGVKLKSCHKSC